MEHALNYVSSFFLSLYGIAALVVLCVGIYWQFNKKAKQKQLAELKKHGMHVVCAQMTEQFLDFSREQGNDLSMPAPEAGFPGLEPGDRWCVCAGRWREAFEAGVAPPVVLSATHEEALAVVPLDALKRHALDIQ